MCKNIVILFNFAYYIILDLQYDYMRIISDDRNRVSSFTDMSIVKNNTAQ